LWRLAWPLILSMFLQFSVGLADVYVAGWFSPEVQGSVGFAGQILFVFNVLANGLGVGLVAVISRSLGGGDRVGARHAARHGIALGCLLSAPFCLAGIVWVPHESLLSFLPGPVAASAGRLLPWYAASLLPQAVMIVSAAIFRAWARVRLVLFCSGLAALLNLGGDFVLAFGCGAIPAMGPEGIAAATAGSSFCGAVLALGLLFARGFWMGGWRLDPSLLRRLWKLGWPVGLLQLGWNLTGLALYGVLGRLPSGAVAATAALTNGLRIEAVLYLPVFALNMITAVLVGQALGAGDPEGAERTGWRVAGAAAAVLGLFAVPVFVFSLDLARIITPDPAVQHLTHLYLRYNMFSQPFMALAVCLGGALEGAGDSFGVMKTVLSVLWAVRIPLSVLFALATPLGASGVWVAMTVSMILLGLAMAARFRHGGWKEIAVIEKL